MRPGQIGARWRKKLTDALSKGDERGGSVKFNGWDIRTPLPSDAPNSTSPFFPFYHHFPFLGCCCWFVVLICCFVIYLFF